MKPNTADFTRIIPPSGGRTMCAFGDEVTILLGAAETGGRYTMFTSTTPPGGGPPPHYHLNEDEWFLVLEGQAQFLKDGQWLEAPMGTTVYSPRGVVHTFRNPGKTPLRMLVHTAPCGFETFFARCEAECKRSGPPDMQRIVQIAGEHGIHFVAP
jgi:mannose-6-phosphate isomerase-like protein (cupin superfamily)